MASNNADRNGLADPGMLEKIDKLFACGVGELVALPQIVVVGDQSSGKSSVLEGLIRKPLPRDSGLCTRFATQIVFRRAVQEQVKVSIIPDPDASKEYASRMAKWGKTMSSLDSKVFKKIMEEAHEQMGLSGGEDAQPKSTFSDDVLRLEISGPGQEHLSVIDVPGIFKSTTEGLTTKADIQLVRNMVKRYMDNPRSVMLAVVPANTDLATQEILELAAESDPHGDRTLGVLTKPDLVDKGAEFGVVDFVEGRSRVMKLGWHIIRNPGQKDLKDPTIDRSVIEATFFRTTAPWDGIEKGKFGVDSLRTRIKEVLSLLVKREFPKVRTEINNRLVARKKQLSGLGPERSTTAAQMGYLVGLATRYQRLVSLAVKASHGADDAFEEKPELCIAPAIVSRMKSFSDEMAQYGELHSFSRPEVRASQTPVPGSSEKHFYNRKEDDVDDLVHILHPSESIPHPQRGHINAWLLEVFKSNRGFELGTFNASILATVMKKQSSKWVDISMGFVSDVIVMVHRFIGSALASICNDRSVRDALTGRLSDELTRRYQKAMTCTGFLLQVEKSDNPVTMNHYFNDNLQNSRQGNVVADMEKHAFDFTGFGQAGSHKAVLLSKISQTNRSMSNEEYVVQDIRDILQSYYKVSRKNFVDNVCKQAVIHHLLESEDGPLTLLSPVTVSKMSTEALEEIAGEPPAMKKTRMQLSKEIESLAKAVIIARS